MPLSARPQPAGCKETVPYPVLRLGLDQGIRRTTLTSERNPHKTSKRLDYCALPPEIRAYRRNRELRNQFPVPETYFPILHELASALIRSGSLIASANGQGVGYCVNSRISFGQEQFDELLESIFHFRSCYGCLRS